ncbi:AARP2CN (NUC121) domain protein [Trypanosoma brucei equiperdum]|uniref:AARP2CN (NUC121) domain protein n=1 Tax=Trypanosoma brucei equiperdum TaxID=630700 RepID=A0A3L6KYE6_9TRYP|nr:AARP2CN (NUC121) domain protein [Trypanosoma brucei equiperdum]
MGADDEQQRNKSHKARVVGSKAVKKEEYRKKKAGIELQPNRGSNTKAFQGPTASSRKGQQLLRSLEKRETALHVPVVDKTLRHVVAEPPLLVAVVGPPGVGKSTLIRSMVKFYSNRNVQVVRGLITVVAGRSRRVTFLECPNTLTAMCDVAKVADLILLMVDGSFGFEMETFEFLNIAQVHGFPRMFGIVSHLDQLKTGKALRKKKRFLRHRFWHEVAAGAKVLCLAPMVRGMYRSTDVLKLHRLLICVEPKIQNWRNTHSCVVVDRYEDITAPQNVVDNEKCNRTIAFYGYARGRPMKVEQLVHIPGLGDFPIMHLSHQDDPCAFDEKNARGESKSQGHKMRHLGMKQKRIYAPYCDVSGVVYDDDAIYIQEDAEKSTIERSGEGLRLIRDLQRVKPIDAAATALEVVRRPVVFRGEDTMELDMGDVKGSNTSVSDDGEEKATESSDDSDWDSGEMASSAAAVKKDLLLYGPGGGDDGLRVNNPSADDAAGLAPRGRGAPDSVRENTIRNDWSNTDLLRRLKNLFVTGNWDSPNDDVGDAASSGAETEGSKGYESEDEEFDAIIRGEAPLDSTNVKDEHEENVDDEGNAETDEEEWDGDGETTDWGAFRPRDALANVGHTSKGTVPHMRNFRAAEAYGSITGGRKGADNDDMTDGSCYDILAEEGDDAVVDSAALSDPELDGLVATFLAPHDASAKRAETSSAALRDDDDSAIQFYDPNHFSKKNDTADDHNDEMEETTAIVGGKPLTEEQERLLQKRMAKKKAFNELYDMGGKNNTYSHYHEMTREVEAKKERLDTALQEVGHDITNKIKLVGHFSGLYVRFVLENVPVEFVQLFDPSVPIIAGGVNAGEDQFQVVHAKLKRHRWFPKILKAQDPLLLSMGWRRFQTQPILATEDPNGRMRYLKYTPMHMHCAAAFYAPVAPANTGFVAIPVREQRSPNFRISCTGYTVGNDLASNIVKKLKLIGTPQKIMKTTAFIKGMFNSDLEAAKYVGAKLKTVAGIRGIVKTVLKGKNGLIRATFEDKIFPSDIVFCRAWKMVEPPKYCSIQRNLVDAEWVGMRPMRELRWAHGVPLESKSDSEYREIRRRNRATVDDGDGKGKTPDVLLSRNQRLKLPFSLKEEYIPLKRSTALQEQIAGATTVAPEPRDMRRTALLDILNEKTEAMWRKKVEAKKRVRERHLRESKAEEEEYQRRLKKAKKETARLREFRSQHKSRK